MNKSTQLEWTKQRLLHDGYVSRNSALENYFTRLGARVNDLINGGWQIDGRWVKTERGKDYQYFLVSSPYKKVIYTVPGLNKKIVSYEKLSTS